jgi:hypothetical protein
MKVHQLLDHYGITANPFAQEDAQSDHVFRQHCLEGTHHPAWDKIYGSPQAPATSVVFGEQGSGKTALRMQMVEQLRRYNLEHPARGRSLSSTTISTRSWIPSASACTDGSGGPIGRWGTGNCGITWTRS